jgi:hypothetical protein
VRTRTAVSVSAIVAIATLWVAVPAGADPPLGVLTVSNSSPTRSSEIQIASTGWQPHGVVSVLLTGTNGVLAQATSDATGAIHAPVPIPADAASGRQVLSVVGPTPDGFPQQITSVLAVTGGLKTPARPWPIVFALAAIAAVLLFVTARSDRRLAAANR